MMLVDTTARSRIRSAMVVSARAGSAAKSMILVVGSLVSRPGVAGAALMSGCCQGAAEVFGVTGGQRQCADECRGRQPLTG
ncbi:MULTISPECIES: hypothetical protein [unclassified Frankia]